jgi:large subunit ribosomal protein L35Ae|eukprot:TRINITY_DN42576_c0_g1_i1.p2 TRINITY_DN42576_c0_g1~~TRINITY_DN42576_c0_g1_i1.p2  ORF type:complete len:115 (-),score=21.15 TRINITY_DN42576_c0_g1_i1:52-396(-)
MVKGTASKKFTPTLHVKGAVVGFTRNLANQKNHTALLKLNNVEDKASSSFYFGKKVVYVYKAEKAKNGSKYRGIWGKITRAHGTNGAVRAKFKTNLPGQAVGQAVRVMLYPSNI